MRWLLLILLLTGCKSELQKFQEQCKFFCDQIDADYTMLRAEHPRACQCKERTK